MKLKLLLLFLIASFVFTFKTSGQTTERPRPEEWKELVYGGRFMDRFLLMPNLGQLNSDTWGDSTVIPRYTDNGIENNKWSFWGGNIIQGDDGKYNMYVCGWLESSPQGHETWPESIVFHAVSDNSFGPFVIKDTIGKGHNPEVFKLKDGRYVLYVIDGNYIADTPNGPWTYGKFELLNRDRRLIEGTSNFTFAQREDGSYLMICRGGGQWISETGVSSYNQVTGTRLDQHGEIIPLRAYPQRPGRFEDPVVWRDYVQYNLIVNDWYGRIAVYGRSKDGVNWRIESGEAYLPGVSVHQDGTVEGWWKYERLKILQDYYGRATQGNFAVIDVEKVDDRANDNHSSKNIGIPIAVGRLLTILNNDPISLDTETIRVKIDAEPDFNPQSDININSLQFGEPEAVNYGKGGKVLKTEKMGDDLIVTFDATNIQFPADEFAAKMLGETNTGELLFGYARLPGVVYIEPILSLLLPNITSTQTGFKLDVEVENFGQVSSGASKLQVAYFKDNREIDLAIGAVPALMPYEKTTVELTCGKLFEVGIDYIFKVTVTPENKQPTVLHGSLIPFK